MAVFKTYRMHFVVIGVVIAFAISWIAQCQRARPRPHAEIPLHWLLLGLGSVGDIHEDHFLYLPIEIQRPQGPPKQPLSPRTEDILTRAVKERLVYPQTVLLLRAYYSNAQIQRFAGSCEYMLQHPAVLDSLRGRQREFIDLLSGERAWGDGERMRFVRALEARRLERLPVGMLYDLDDAANGTPVSAIAPRLLTQQIWALHRLSVQPNPATNPGHVRMLQDTSLALSARIELTRHLQLAPYADPDLARSTEAQAHRRAAERDSVYQMLVRGETPHGRYSVLDLER